MEAPNVKRLLETAWTFLQGKMSREAFVFLFFVFLSATFWLIQTLNETNDLDLEYDLELENVPEGTVITSEFPSTLQVTVRDKGTSLIRYVSHFGRRHLTVDFAQYDKGVTYGHVIVPQADIVKELQLELDASTRIVSQHPDTLEYYYNRGVSKRVPVEFIGRVETDALSYLADFSVNPDTVTVWAEEHFLDSLEVVRTVPTTLTDLHQNTTRKVPLVSMKGVKIVPSEITVNASVDIYIEKRITVPIVGTNFPAGYALRTFPTRATISFRVGSKDYAKYDTDNFVLTMTYEELISRSDSTFHLELSSIPDGVSRVKIEPEVVQFLIEQTDDAEDVED